MYESFPPQYIIHPFPSTTWLRENRGLERISTQIVEKDYYVTEVLRIIASSFGSAVLFKGWGFIQRFSEDVDLFLNPKVFDED